MKILSFLQSLFRKTTKLTTPKIAITPVESIEFPDTYKDINIYHTIPDRVGSGISGSEFGQSILNIPAGQQRDNLIYQQCMAGNIPDWMRAFKAITTKERDNTLTYFVSSDVLSVGNNDDFIRVSLDGLTARKICDNFGCMLPTSKMSYQIWKAADLKLIPQSMGASPNMTNTQTLINHNNIIEQQRADRNFNIVTGHKKDIVYTKHLLADKTRLAIYGWFYPNGIAIQGPNPNSTSHDIRYQDYSSSIRLISQKAILNQQIVNLYDVLNNDQYSYLISDEGTYNASNIYR